MESGTMMYVYHDNPLNNDFLNVLANSQLCAREMIHSFLSKQRNCILRVIFFSHLLKCHLTDRKSDL